MFNRKFVCRLALSLIIVTRHLVSTFFRFLSVNRWSGPSFPKSPGIPQHHYFTRQNNASALRRIFFCHDGPGDGMVEIMSIFRSVLPEYSFESLSKYLSIHPPHVSYEKLFGIPTNNQDIFLGLSYPLGCRDPITQWLLLGFRGNIVIYSPESPHNHPDLAILRDNIHYFGHVKKQVKRSGDMLLTYLQTTWWNDLRAHLPIPALINGKKRPKADVSAFMIYAQGNCVNFREIAAWEFSKLGPVHLGGRCRGIALDGNRTNLQKIETGISLSNWRDNIHLYKKYEFCLVMEHEEDHESYITEKILLAYMGGCIPIYHGPPLIFDIFNRESFIFYNLSKPQEALEQVKTLREDSTLYHKMINVPILAKGRRTLEKYFSFSDEIENGRLKQRIREKLGIMSLQT